MNQAFEDAVELAQAVQEQGLTPDSLRAYEAKRIPRVQQILAAEMVSLATAIWLLTLHPYKMGSTCVQVAGAKGCAQCVPQWLTPQFHTQLGGTCVI